MKHSKPLIKDVVARMSGDGVVKAVCIALAPHYSITGIGSYISRVEDANASLARAMDVRFVKSWHLDSMLTEFWAGSIAKASEGIENPFVVFSAHSLPEEVEEKGPYRKQLLETAAEVAKKAYVNHWGLSFQSQSGRGEKWYGPTIMEMIEWEARSGEAVVVAPVGFVSDNLEILYDLDIELKTWASERNIRLSRAGMPNSSDALIDALSASVNGV